MTEAEYAVWDCETSGIDVFEDRIVQFFFATADAEGNLLNSFEWIIDPGVPIPEEASNVHGLTEEYLAKNGMHPEDAFTEIRKVFLSHLSLTHVAFNMNFDLSILDAEFKRHLAVENFGAFMRDSVRLIDGIVIDRHHDKYRKGRRTLEAQAKHYGVPFNPDEAHDAGYDVAVTAKVTVKILEKFGMPTNEEQSVCYAEWARGLQEYLRRSDPEAVVDGDWPVRTKG